MTCISRCNSSNIFLKCVFKMHSVNSPTNISSDHVDITNHASSGPLTEAERIKSRINSFRGWTGVRSPTQLAIAGFRFTGTSDKVMCDTCGLKLFNWKESDNALQVHKTYSPGCSFIMKWFSCPENAADHSSIPRPSYPNYSTYLERLDSFYGWPLKHEHQSPSNMARYGFFYIGSADRVCCFQCGLRLRDWDEDDYPSECHKEWSPNCPFINNANEPSGPSFSARDTRENLEQSIEEHTVADNMSSATNNLLVNNTTSCCSADAQFVPEVKVTSYATDGLGNTVSCGLTDARGLPEIKVRSCAANATDARHNDTSRGSVEATSCDANTNDAFHVNWGSPKVQAVIEMGCEKELVERVTLERLRNTGEDFPNAAALYEAIIEVEN